MQKQIEQRKITGEGGELKTEKGSQGSSFAFESSHWDFTPASSVPKRKAQIVQSDNPIATSFQAGDPKH